MRTLEQCRDEFKRVMRAPTEKEWQRRCGLIGRLGTVEERGVFKETILRDTGPLMDSMLQVMGIDPQAKSDARSVLCEIVDELPTIEETN